MSVGACVLMMIDRGALARQSPFPALRTTSFSAPEPAPARQILSAAGLNPKAVEASALSALYFVPKLGTEKLFRRLADDDRLSQIAVHRTIFAAKRRSARPDRVTAPRGKLTIGLVVRRRTAQVRKQKSGGEAGLGVLARRAQDRSPGADRIVVDEPDEILLPRLQSKRLADVLALRDKQGLAR